MFDDIGSKIKSLAKYFGWICVVLGILFWIIFIFNTETYSTGFGGRKTVRFDEDNWLGWVSLILGFVGYILSWVLCGFGQLVEDTQALREYFCPGDQEVLTSGNNTTPMAPPKPVVRANFNGWTCSRCGSTNPLGQFKCKNCGKS